MDIQELAIGCWVLCKGNPVLVKEVETDWITVKTHNGLDCVAPNRLKPIPLSGDLLERCGFKVTEKYTKQTGGVAYMTWSSQLGAFGLDITVGLSNTVGRDWSIHIDNADHQTVASCDIAYVHQAQQLARLVGSDGIFDNMFR